MDLFYEPKKFFDRMSKQQALDILQKQIDAYQRGGEWAPRNHFGRALEIAADALREDIDGGQNEEV